MQKLLMLDTTLRDGEQTPGLSLTPDKKVIIARKLDELGVDVIEAGTAVASDGERSAIRKITDLGLKSEIASFCRGIIKDIDAAISCNVTTITLVVPTSDLHIQKKLKKSREEVLGITRNCIEYAKKNGLVVEFLAEDGSRTTTPELLEFFKVAVEAKADRVCVCDTVGILAPEKTYELFSELTKKIKLPMAVHCHNDLGLGVANTLAAVKGGAREVHCTVNGLGERTGNAPLEEVALDLEYLYKIKTVDIKKLSEISSLIENITGIALARNKPIVGKNAFTHESGIHVDGILKAPSTYEPITPEMVGQKRRIVLGKHSGSQAIKLKLKELGVDVNEEQMNAIFKKVKEIGDTGKEITDADFHAVVFDILGTQKEAKVKLEEMVAITGSRVTPTASVKLLIGNEQRISSAVGNGPVDAAIRAIENSLGIKGVELVSYHVDAITGGTNALVTVKIRIKKGEKEVSATGTGTDIVMASVEAMLRGLNLLV